MEFFRRSDTGGRLALNSPLNQFDISSQLSRRTSPSTETDKSGAPSRKRVPVAVSSLWHLAKQSNRTDSVRDAGNARSSAAVTRAEAAQIAVTQGMRTLAPSYEYSEPTVALIAFANPCRSNLMGSIHWCR